MAEQIRHPDGRIEHPSVRYEKTDASLRDILVLMACAVVLGIAIYLVVWQFFIHYSDHLAEKGKSSFPLAPAPATALPREPRLEQLDRLSGEDASNVYVRLKAKEDALRRYGGSEEIGYVHVPIEKAIDYFANRLPVRKQEADGPRHDLGLVDGGESNSGRLFRKEPR
jgi:hypothetical protein